MSNKESKTALQFSVQHFKNDKLSYGAINAAAIKFNIHRSTVCRWWKQAKNSKINGDEIFNVNLQKKWQIRKKKKRFFIKVFLFSIFIFFICSTYFGTNFSKQIYGFARS